MDNTRKKLLILIDWFMPGFKAGGPVQSVVNICRLLHHQYDIYVLTTDTDHGESRPYQDIKANEWIKNEVLGINIFYAQKKNISLRQIREQIELVQADTLYLNLLFSYHFTIYPLWLKYRGKLNSKIVLCPRGTLYESALAVKRFKKQPALQLFKSLHIARLVSFHATNKREEAAILRYFPNSEVIIANNLPELNQPKLTYVKKEIGLLRCVFIARIVPIKNLLYLLNVLKGVEAKIHLSIVGPIEDNTYWNECRKTITELPATILVEYMGARAADELTSILQQHHLFILPTLGENFGHAIFESMLAGRPVLISDQTPWQQLSEKEAGWDLPLTQPELFSAKINYLSNCNQQEYDQFVAGAWNYAYHFINDPSLVKPYQTLFE